MAALEVTFITLQWLQLAVHCINMFGQVTSSRCAEIANVTHNIILLEMHRLDMCLHVAPVAALVVTFWTLKGLQLAVNRLNMLGQVTSFRCP